MTDTNNNPETVVEEQKQKNITRDDVRQAVGDVDPSATNAGRIREILGRGSLATIQKFLEELRGEKAPVLQPGEIPNAPKDLVTSLWQAAYQAAQSQSFNLVAMATALKDQALQRVQTLEKDIEMFAEFESSATEKIHILEEKVDSCELKCKAYEDTMKRDFDLFQAREAQLRDEIVKAQEALAQASKDASAAAALHKEQHEHKEAMHQQQREFMRLELARLTDQVGELKAALYKRAEQPAVVSGAKKGD